MKAFALSGCDAEERREIVKVRGVEAVFMLELWGGRTMSELGILKASIILHIDTILLLL